MSLSIHVTGSTNDRIKQAAFALSKDPTVANAYISGVELVESLTFYLAKEMDSVRKDIFYWKSLMTAGSTLTKMTMEYIKIYRSIKISLLNIANISSQTEKTPKVGQFDRIEDHIAVLRSRLESLASLLVLVYDASVYLKLVSIHVENASTRALQYSVDGIDADISADCIEFARQCTEKCFKKLSTGFAARSPNLSIYKSRQTSFERIMAIASPHFAKSKSPFSDSEKDDLLIEQHAVESLLQSMKMSDAEYPIGTTEISSRRPTISERYWLLNVAVLIGSLYTWAQLYRMILDGSLRHMITHAVEGIKSSAILHIVEPAQKLCSELFETISRRQEGIVTHKDLEESRKTLAKMLSDYDEANKKSGSVFSSLSVLVGTKSDKVNTSTGSAGVPVAGGSPVAGAAPTSEEAVMESLMRSYEDDMKSPIASMVTGNLMTRLLIQMQKLKLHTESALLTMDQVLASNQLTMAGTAAMPALCFLGFVGYNLYHYLFPEPVKTGKATLQLRLVMADVERCLLDVYDSDRRATGQWPAKVKPDPAAYFDAPIFGEMDAATSGGWGDSADIAHSRSMDSVHSATVGSQEDLSKPPGNSISADPGGPAGVSGGSPCTSVFNCLGDRSASSASQGRHEDAFSMDAGRHTTQTPFREKRKDLSLRLVPTDDSTMNASDCSSPLLPHPLYSRYASPEQFAKQHFGVRAADSATSVAGGTTHGPVRSNVSADFQRLNISRSADDAELNAFFAHHAAADQLVAESGGRPKSSVVKRGMLYFHLYRLRACFSHLFRPRGLRQSRTWEIFGKEYWSQYADTLSSYGRQWPSYSMISLFFSLLLREDREYFSHDSEYRSILKDLSELLSPDFEISGDRKLSAANRMRLSYQCLMPAP